MPASPPAPGVLYHPSEKGPISPASTPHLIGCLPIHSSTIQTTRRSALLLCPYAASHLPPTKAPPVPWVFSTPFASPFTRPFTLLSCVAFYHRSRSLLVAFLLCLFIIGYPAFEQHPHFSLSDARLPARTLSPLPPNRERPFFARLYIPPCRVSFIHSSSTATTRRSALLLCPHAASHLPPTKVAPYLGFFPPPSLRPHRRRTPHCHPFVLGFLAR